MNAINGAAVLCQPPHSAEAEQSVLASLLIDNGAWDRAGDLLTERDFHCRDHALIYAAIGKLIADGQPADVITVFERLKRLGKAEECGGLVYLNQLAQSVPSAANLHRYAEIVRERSELRRLAAVADEIKAAALDPKGRSAADIIDGALAALARGGRSSEWRPAAWAARACVWELPDVSQDPAQPVMAVDQLIQAGRTGVLVAGGGTGKTSLMLWLAVCHATGRPFCGLDVAEGSFALFSLDDAQDDLDAALVLVIRAANLTELEMAKVRKRLRVVSLQGGVDEPRTFSTLLDRQSHPTDLARHIAAACDGLPDLIGVALDTLRQFSGGSSNDEVTMKLMIAGAGEVVQLLGGRVYSMISHHQGKAQFRDGVADLYSGSGSAAIGDNARFVLTLLPGKWDEVAQRFAEPIAQTGDPLTLASGRGSLRVKHRAEPLYIRREGFRFACVEGHLRSDDERTHELDRKILAAVEAGARSGNAVTAAIGGKRATILDRIAAMKATGLLHSVPAGSQGKEPAGLALTEVAQRAKS